MKKIILLLFFGINVFGQEVIIKDSINKSNPILFSESFFGLGGSENGGIFLVGLNLNYQFRKNDLLTARYTLNTSFSRQQVILSPLITLITVKSEIVNEYALMYGKRYIFNNCSLSFSSGISYGDITFYKNNDNYDQEVVQYSIGVPFEINLKFFKGEKSRFRAYYGLIPIGKKKVSFGRSVGFKLIGNIVNNEYFGLAFTYGFGWHKKY
jgi:hypothetical protein